MNLYVDSSYGSCFDVLKIVAVAREYNESINVVPIDGKDCASFSSLPLLEFGKTKLFVINVICLFLAERQSGISSKEVLEFVQYEADLFHPLMTAFYKNKNYLSILEHLRQLDERVTRTKFMCDICCSIGDIIIWSDLYPATIKDSNFLDSFSNLRFWFYNSMSEKPAMVHALQQFNFKGTVPSTVDSWLFPPIEQSQSDIGSNQNVSYVDGEKVRCSWLKGWRLRAKETVAGEKILPCQHERNILITSALPYVNNIPHLGNIVGSVLSADVFARFCRLRGYNVLYVCGTDEYGTCTETKAIEEGTTPKDLCQKYYEIHRAVYEWFGISFDVFGRTTTSEQTEIAQSIFLSLREQGFLDEDEMNQLFCLKCDRFLADRFVEGTCPLCAYTDARGDQCDGCGKLINATELGEPRCKMCHSQPVIRSSRHVFLNLPKIETLLRKWFDSSSEGWSSNAKIIAKSWLKTGLQSRCITRDLKWGTPVPLKEFENKVFYVWFDAPIGYISITATYTKDWHLWWKNPFQVEYYQFMAKDNVPFHAVVFPCTLIGTGDNWTLVNHIISTEYLNYEDVKFSKSRGIGVFGTDAKQTGIPCDIWRFYLLYTRPENQDSNFQWNDFILKVNSELLANLGNFVNRALRFCKDNFDGIVGQVDLSEERKEEIDFVAMVTEHLTSYINLLEKSLQREAISHILSISRLGNRLMQSTKPWKLIKNPGVDQDRARSIIGLCVNTVCLLSVMMKPYMPHVAEDLQCQLNAPTHINQLNYEFGCMLAQGHEIGNPSPLITEVKSDDIERWKYQFSAKQAERPN